MIGPGFPDFDGVGCILRSPERRAGTASKGASPANAPEAGTWTPMAGRAAKTTETDWIDAAKRTLIDEGIGGVKIDRLARRLGVTRSGFYRFFNDREEFLDRLIAHWEATCRLLPQEPPRITPEPPVARIERFITHLTEPHGYDFRFDLAVRGWARADKRAAWAIERADRERLEALQLLFETIGYDKKSAEIRAKVTYFTLIGSFTIGDWQSVAERHKIMQRHIDMLCEEKLGSAKSDAD